MEIKFRAWTRGEDGTWRGPWYGGFAIHATGNIIDSELIPKGKIEVEQFTGIKDKNGVEIYEGDIIRWTDITERGDTRTETVGTSVVFALEKYIDAMNWIPKHGAVIGNIHQNPELLK